MPIIAQFSIRLTSYVPFHIDELMSNFFAQPDALACGKTIAELEAEKVPPALHSHKEFPGNRPSLSMLFPELTPYTCGQVLCTLYARYIHTYIHTYIHIYTHT
jgi:glucose-6-phosphate isomerase